MSKATSFADFSDAAAERLHQLKLLGGIHTISLSLYFGLAGIALFVVIGLTAPPAAKETASSSAKPTTHDFWQIRLIYEVVPEIMSFSAGEDGDEISFKDPAFFRDSNSEVERQIYREAGTPDKI